MTRRILCLPLVAAMFFTAFALSPAWAQSSPSPSIGLRAPTAKPLAAPEELGDMGTASAETIKNCYNDQPDACLQAADEGNAEAMRRVALAYHFGNWGYPRDNDQYMAWLDKSARSKSFISQMMLATSYTGGLRGGGRNDPMMAYVWYSVAAENTKDAEHRAAMLKGKQILNRDIPKTDLTRAEQLRAEYVRLYAR